MANPVTLFKSYKGAIQFPTKGFGIVAFTKGRFATIDPDLADYIETKLLRDPALQIYIDPDEPTIDLDEALSTVQLRPDELRQFIYDQEIGQRLAPSEYEAKDVKPLGTSASPLTGGASGTQRFTAGELAKARLSALHEKKEQTEGQ